jgi:CysZ protein
MIAAAALAFNQLFTPPFRAVLFKSLGLTIALLVVAIIGLETLFGTLVQLPGWAETTLQVLGGLGLVIGSVFLIAPITSLIAGLYLDDVAEEVEKRYYPGEAPGRELPVMRSLWLSAKFFVVVVIVNVIALFLLLVPGVNIIAFYVANGYLLGREFFELAAFRHMPLEDARALRRHNAFRVFLSGLAIAFLASIPIVNLITPLFATAFMVHTFKQVARKRA